MKVQVEELSPIERKLSIEVEGTEVDSELSRAYTQLGRQVKIPGFRPGKIPRRILEQKFKQEVEGDVIQRLVQRTYMEAIRDHKVEAVSDPMVTQKTFAASQPFAYEARVEVRPRVQPKDYTGVALTRTEVKVEDAQIAERMEQMRKRFARLDPVSGGREVAKAGDYAVVDYTGTVDGKEIPGGKAENATVQVAPGELVQGNIPQLEGVKVGDSQQLDYTFPADYPLEEAKGKTAHFTVHLKGLKEEIIPELDDEFAKEIGGGNTLEEMRTKIRGDLEKSQKLQAETKEREELIKALVEKNAFDLPKAMTERAIDSMLEGALRQMMRSGLDPRSLDLDFNKLREDLRERAESEVRGALIFEAIADQEKIEISEEEIEKKIAELASESNQALSAVQKHFRTPAERRSLTLRLREEKTVEFLKSRAKYS